MLATKFLLRELFAFLLGGLLPLPFLPGAPPPLLDLLGVLLRFLFGLFLQLVEVAGHGPSIPAAAALAAPVRPGAYPPLEERHLCGPLIGEGIMSMLFAPYVRHVLHGSSQAYGLVAAVQAIGGLAGGVIAASVGRRISASQLT